MRFGLIGTGYWARVTSGAALAAHPGIEFAGVWGRRPEAAQALAAELGTRAYAAADALIADVDAVAFSVPPQVQAELAIRAARAGRHLLLDKPIGLDLGTAERLTEAVESSGVESIVFFTSRFVPEIRDWLAAAIQTGGWHGAQLSMYASIFQPDSPYNDSTWRKESGALWDVGPHALSLALPVLGPVRDVVALGGDGDTVNAVLRHDGGATTALLLSLTAPPAATFACRTFFGESGVAEVPDVGDPVAAFTQCVTQLIDGETAGLDIRFGRDVVAVLAQIENQLAAT